MGDDEDGDMSELHAELHTLPFAQLQKLRERLGTKRFRQLFAVGGQADEAPASGEDVRDSAEKDMGQRTGAKKVRPGQRAMGGRVNKNRPREESSRQRVPRVRQVVPVSKQITRDPRFDDLSGSFDQDGFDKSYSFLSGKKAQEKAALEKELKKTRNAEKKVELKQLLQSLRDKELDTKKKAKERKFRSERRKAERELVRKGKTPYFLKRSDEKKLQLIEQFDELSKKGKLKKTLKSRRKHQTKKARDEMPSERRDGLA